MQILAIPCNKNIKKLPDQQRRPAVLTLHRRLRPPPVFRPLLKPDLMAAILIFDSIVKSVGPRPLWMSLGSGRLLVPIRLKKKKKNRYFY